MNVGIKKGHAITLNFWNISEMGTIEWSNSEFNLYDQICSEQQLALKSVVSVLWQQEDMLFFCSQVCLFGST